MKRSPRRYEKQLSSIADDDGTRSQYDVARELGISRARVKQIEDAAIAKLRKLARARGVER